MALSDHNVTAIRRLQDRAAARAKAGIDGVPVMTAERLRVACLENDGYDTPELNDRLYLHYTGYRRIEGLDAYTGVKALWLECNGLTRIENLHPLQQLRCLYLQNNLIESVGDGLATLVNLVTLDLTGNRLTHLDGLSCLPLLSTLSVGKNALASSATIEHLAECAAVTTLDLSDNQLEADGENACLHLLARMPKLATLYLKGNPLVRDTRFYRKTTLTVLPVLRYLDDRPVFEAERVATDAWAAGGQAAEAAARAAYEAEQKAKSKHDTLRFQQWQEGVRQRRAAELEALNEERRSRGDEDLAALPSRSYVTYGKVSEKAREEHVRMKILMERAEEVARTTGFHGTAMMDLGREYWAANGATAAVTGEGKEEEPGDVDPDDDGEEKASPSLATPSPASEPIAPIAHSTSAGGVQYVNATTGAPIREADEVPDEEILDRVRHSTSSTAPQLPSSAAAPKPVAAQGPVVDVERQQRDAAVQESLRIFNARAAAEASSATGAEAAEGAQDVWFHELDAALRKFSKQAAFDFAKVARALSVAVTSMKLPVPAAISALHNGTSGIASLLTPDACRLRYAHLSAADSAALPPAPVAADSAMAAGSISDPRVAAVVAMQSMASTSLPADLYADLGDVSEPATGHAGPGRAIRPVSDLLQGEFKLDRFRQYVAAPKNLPSLAARGAVEVANMNNSANEEEDDDAAAAQAFRPGGHRRTPIPSQPRVQAVTRHAVTVDDDENEEDADHPLTREEILRSIHAAVGGSAQVVHPDMLGDGRVVSALAEEEDAGLPVQQARLQRRANSNQTAAHARTSSPIAAATVVAAPALQTDVDELD